MSSRILLVEDDPGLVLTLSVLFTEAGYEVETAGDGEIAISKAAEVSPDLIILDVTLPKKNGFEVCSQLRGRGVEAGILMLTARTQVADRVLGLGLGADDYLAKPFDPPELLARVEALLRRVKKQERASTRSFEFGDVRVDFGRALVTRSGRRISLAGKELELLEYLIHHRGRVVPREEILKNVWEYSGNVSSRTIDVHVTWLRQKIERDPQQPEHIHTIRGKGYRFSS